jgi:hypothetical protein
MNSILTRVADSLGRFTPSKPREYLALQIARKLNDASAVRHYAILFEHHPEELLLGAYHRCASERRLTGEQFMRELRK